MGVGYQVSALCRIKVPDWDASSRPALPSEDPIGERLGFCSRIIEGPMRYRPLSAGDVLAWRGRLSARYRSQLGEDLVWDEASTIEVGEDAYATGDTLMRYVAAMLDQADPAATAWTAQTSGLPEDVLAAAWQASDTVSRLCAMAVGQRLPLWTMN